MLNWRAHLKREIARCNSSFASFAYEERCGCGAQFSATVKRLKYRKPGGGKGIRTPGLLIANETLYQLSYTPESGRHLIRLRWFFKPGCEFSVRVFRPDRHLQSLEHFANRRLVDRLGANLRGNLGSL